MPAINTDMLARQLPDTARWIYARSMLLANEGDVYGLREGRSGFIVMNARQRLAAVVGEPPAAAFELMLHDAPASLELIAPPTSAACVRSALSDWDAVEASLHLRRGSWIVPDTQAPASRSDLPSGESGAVRGDREHRTELVARDEALNDRTIPEILRSGLEQALPGSPAAVALAEDGVVVSMCSTAAITEMLWDVSIETLEACRRRGFAAACVAALARYMEGLGKRAVWGAEDGNIESAALAQKLGFAAVDRLVVFHRSD